MSKNTAVTVLIIVLLVIILGITAGLIKTKTMDVALANKSVGILTAAAALLYIGQEVYERSVMKEFTSFH